MGILIGVTCTNGEIYQHVLAYNPEVSGMSKKLLAVLVGCA